MKLKLLYKHINEQHLDSFVCCKISNYLNQLNVRKLLKMIY